MVNNEFCGTATIIGPVEGGLLGTEYVVRSANGEKVTRTTHELKRMRAATKRTASPLPLPPPPAKRPNLLSKLHGDRPNAKVVINEQRNTSYGEAKAAADADFIADNHDGADRQRAANAANSRWARLPRVAGSPQGIQKGPAQREGAPGRAALRGGNDSRARQAPEQDSI